MGVSVALAVRAIYRSRSRSLGDLGQRRVELKVWRRTEQGLQVVEEESVVFSNIEVRVKRTGPLGLGDLGDGIYCTHTYTQRAIRERGRRICPPGNDRSKIHA